MDSTSKRQQTPRSNEGFLNAVLDNAGALVVVLDRKGRVCLFNHAAETVYGAPFAEVEGRYPWDTFLPPEDADTIRKEAFEALASNPEALAGHYTNFWLSRSGTRRLIEWCNTLLLDRKGAMEYMVCVGTDITERTRFESALRESEERYRSVIAALSEGIVVQDADGQIIASNDAAEHILGLTADQLRGRTSVDPRWRSVHEDGSPFPGDDHPASVSLRTGEPCNDVVMGVHRPDGCLTWISINAQPLRQTGMERPIGVVTSFTDITERRRAAEALRNSQRQLRGLLDNLAVFVSVFTPDGVCIETNEAPLKAAHLPRDQLVGRKFWDTYYFSYSETARAAARRAIEAAARGETVRGDLLVRVGDDNYIALDATVSPLFDDQGRVVQIIASGIDVTERKRAEEEIERHRDNLESLVRERTAEIEQQAYRNKTIVETAMDGFFTAGLERRITDCNDAYCRMLGYTRDELLQLYVTDIEAIENAAEVAAHAETLMRQGHDRFDTRHRRKDGSTMDVEVNVTVAAIGESPLVVAFVHDISDRKRAEAELIRARDAAERASLAKSEFLSRMSHELRTPMNAILGFAQLLQLETLAGNQMSYVGEIMQAGDHLLNLINELLDLSRIESGRLDTSRQRIALTSAVREAISIVQPDIDTHGLTLDLHCDDDYTVIGDPTRLKQILVNLLSNAVKYNRDQLGEIRVRCVAQAPDRVRITVSDTGVGISKADMGRIFQPFERLDAARRGIEGTGIGLALSKQLAEMMGGAIGVESTLGKGSSFWLELPIQH
jgi:PAS domain S-box-containing protein